MSRYPLLFLLLFGCGGAELIIGRHAQGEHNKMIRKKTFSPGEPIALYLRNATFRDSLLDLTVCSIAKNGKRQRSRSIRLPSINTNLNYLKILEGVFFLPLPGKYTISISQAEGVIARTTVTVRE